MAARSSSRSSPASASAAGRIGGDELPEQPGLHGQPGQLGAEPVVQVAAQPAPLLLAGGHQPFAGALQVGGQPDGGDGHPGLAGQVGQQPPVGGGEAVLARPQARGRACRPAVLVEQRQRSVAAAGSPAVATAPAPSSTSRSRRTAAGAPPARVETMVGQDGVRGQRALQPLAQPGQRGVGLGPLAVEQPARPPAAAGRAAGRTARRRCRWPRARSAGRPRGAARRRGSRRRARTRRRRRR